MKKMLMFALFVSLFAVGCEFSVKPAHEREKFKVAPPAPPVQPTPPQPQPQPPPIVIPVVPVVPGYTGEFMEGYKDSYCFKTIRPGKWALDPEYRRGFTLGESDRHHGIIRFIGLVPAR